MVVTVVTVVTLVRKKFLNFLYFFVLKVFTTQTQRDRLHRETMDFLRLSTALHSCQNILSENEQWIFLWGPEVLLSLKDKLSRVVANNLVIGE